MNKDPNGGGSELDGTLNAKYCSLCYEAGVFTHPDFTVTEMQVFCVEKLQEKGMPRQGNRMSFTPELSGKENPRPKPPSVALT